MGKSAMADATKTTARPTGHMTYTQAPVACEKNIFHLFCFTQPVKNYSFHTSPNTQMCWCMMETSSVLPRRSLVIFRNLR